MLNGLHPIIKQKFHFSASGKLLNSSFLNCFVTNHKTENDATSYHFNVFNLSKNYYCQIDSYFFKYSVRQAVMTVPNLNYLRHLPPHVSQSSYSKCISTLGTIDYSQLRIFISYALLGQLQNKICLTN